MANEVTINIESSLAAMAFVVADQQDMIKTLREMSAEWEKMYNDEQTEKLALREKINNLTNNYTDAIEGLKAQCKQQQEETDIYKDKAEGLYQENLQLVERNNHLYARILQWHPIETEDTQFTNYPLGITTEEYPDICLLIKVEYIKEGMWDSNNQPVHIGRQVITPDYPTIVEHQWTLNNNDSYVKVLAWCVVTNENFAKDEH